MKKLKKNRLGACVLCAFSFVRLCGEAQAQGYPPDSGPTAHRFYPNPPPAPNQDMFPNYSPQVVHYDFLPTAPPVQPPQYVVSPDYIVPLTPLTPLDRFLPNPDMVQSAPLQPLPIQVTPAQTFYPNPPRAPEAETFLP